MILTYPGMHIPYQKQQSAANVGMNLVRHSSVRDLKIKRRLLTNPRRLIHIVFVDVRKIGMVVCNASPKFGKKSPVEIVSLRRLNFQVLTFDPPSMPFR